MHDMNDTELIKAVGGQTALATAINDKLRPGDAPISPQRVNGWKAKNKIPPYFKLAYPKVFKIAAPPPPSGSEYGRLMRW